MQNHYTGICDLAPNGNGAHETENQRAPDSLEIWPESGFGRPAAILGVNKRSEG